MNKQEMLDFLYSYHTMIKLENNNRWENNTYHDDMISLTWKLSRKICAFVFNVCCNSDFTDISIIAQDDFTAGVLDELNEMLIDRNFSMRQHKFGTFKYNIGASIDIKSEHLEAREIILFCMENIEGLVENTLERWT